MWVWIWEIGTYVLITGGAAGLKLFYQWIQMMNGSGGGGGGGW